jgi:FemAB-related protein (PEP-CTERM system-associated)
MLVVKQLNPLDAPTAARWDDFVMACPNATFFHRAGWQKIMREVFHHDTYFLYAERDGSIQGVLSLGHVQSRLFGNALVSLPFAVYGGIASSGSAIDEALENAAQKMGNRLGVSHLEFRNIRARHVDWPTQDLYVTFRKELSEDDDANLLAIPRKQRAMVRKGIKLGLKSELDCSAERFFDLYASNVHRHGTPALSKKYFKALLDVFGDDCEVLTVSTPDGRALSSVLSFYFRDEVLPYYAGDDVLARDCAANDFKYWELMRRACARGIKMFDFGRSKKGTGSYQFKKNWGFNPQPLHYEYCLYTLDSIPQNNPANKKFKLLIDIWRRLPLKVANLLGPYVVRHLG